MAPDGENPSTPTPGGDPADLPGRFESRIRILAAHHLPAGRVEEVVERTLSAVRDAVESGRVRTDARFVLGAFVYETALRQIARHPAGETSDPLDLLFDRGVHGASARTLDAMDPEDREILEMAFRRGLSPREIAAALDLPFTRAVERKRRALKRFEALYPGEAPGS